MDPDKQKWDRNNVQLYILGLEDFDTAAAGLSQKRGRTLWAAIWSGRLRTRRGLLFWDDKQIVPKEDVEAVLSRIYRNEEMTQNGRDSLWSKIREQYYGISQADVMAFLRKQKGWQMIQPKVRKVIFEPRASKLMQPNSLWVIDHFMMKKYRGKEYVFVVIDGFSRYIWCFPVPNKNTENVIRCLDMLIDRVGIPNTIGGDNAFKNNEFVAWCRENSIKMAFARPYSPWSSGLVERGIRSIKQKLFSYLARNNTMDWIKGLKIVVNNYNMTKHSSIKARPMDAFLDPTDDMRIANINAGVKSVRKYAHNLSRIPNFRVGMRVRVHLSRFKRKEREAAMKKKYIPQWSEKVFRIYEISGSRIFLEDDEHRYTSAYSPNDLMPV